jgi:chloramphenicol-sensitive protein RarD
MSLEYSPQQLRSGLSLAIVANILWGVAALFWIETAPVEAIDVVAHRAVWSLPIAAVILLMAGRLRPTIDLMRAGSTFFWSLLAAGLLGVNWGVFVYAVTVGRATEASLGYFMLPLLTIGVGRVLFHEALGWSDRLAIALAIFAVLVQLISYGSLPWISLALASSFSLYGAIRKKIAADTIQGLFIETLCMAPVALVWLWLTDGAGMGVHGLKVDSFLLMSGIYTTAPLLTYIAAARLLPLSVVGYTSYLGPTLQLLVAQTLLGESIDGVTALSFALVWLGVLLVSGRGLLRMTRRSARTSS